MAQAGGKQVVTEPRIAVLGAGIMGSAVALFLARQGARVTLIDEASEAFSGASRWNEGKIHLGYLYAGDASGRTAARVLPGGLVFRKLTEELIGCSIATAITHGDDIYLVHRDSVTGAAAMGEYFEKVTRAAREHPQAREYLVDLSDRHVQRLSTEELEQLTPSPLILGGYRVPEHSVQTNWIADRFLDALSAERRIEMVMRTYVSGVREYGHSWRLETTPAIAEQFDWVINALWHGRLAIDRTAGLKAEGNWSHRYRLSLFVHTPETIAAQNAVLATGPFGDMKNYNGRDFYLSWYPAGLIAEGISVSPPRVKLPGRSEQREITAAIVDQLGTFLPVVRTIAAQATETRLAGGWVFALGEGSLSDQRATLHRRDQFGIREHGTYLSVDTGKYSTAPWLAEKIAERVAASIR